MRAGMTRARIAEAAGKLRLEGGADNFSIRAVAKALGVVPATIRSHFKGGMDDLLTEITRSALAELTLPYKPQQDPKDYLRGFFRTALAAFRQQPQLGRLVVTHLSDDPLLSPVFAESICATLAAIAKTQDVGWAFQLFSIVCPAWSSWRRRIGWPASQTPSRQKFTNRPRFCPAPNIRRQVRQRETCRGSDQARRGRLRGQGRQRDGRCSDRRVRKRRLVATSGQAGNSRLLY